MNHFYQLNEDELALCSIVIWAVLDPANPFIAPSSAPFVIGFVSYILESCSPPENRAIRKIRTCQLSGLCQYGLGFANVTISTDLARDLGTRIVAAIFYGGDAFNTYVLIAILVNVLATLFGEPYSHNMLLFPCMRTQRVRRSWYVYLSW